MNRAYFSDDISVFLERNSNDILSTLVINARAEGSSIESTQIDAWLETISILKSSFEPFRNEGSIYLEYTIPRLGKRIDALAIIGSVIFVFEFKVGESQFKLSAIDQVYDYAIDLKNFHETSHTVPIAPILIATLAEATVSTIAFTKHEDQVFIPIRATPTTLGDVISNVLRKLNGIPIKRQAWEAGRYCPTPTIIEAAMALYGGHKVEDISKKEAGAENLTLTSAALEKIIRDSQKNSWKSICFVTGVPGAGKTLVGLDIATNHNDNQSDLYSVFLSGNGPLVAVLREALARDKVRRLKEKGKKIKIGTARSEVSAFIQNVHHFRNDCLKDIQRPPVEHVVIFDEAQRAWDLRQTAKFMEKRGKSDFSMSEPEFLISCLDRHLDWAVVVCLVGGGQEINTGETGITEWIDSVKRSFPAWRLYVSSNLTDSEYDLGHTSDDLQAARNTTLLDELHLSISMRSFRTEKLSLLVKQTLDLDRTAAIQTLSSVRDRYPIVLTRDLEKAKKWLKSMARGNERYGLVASSNAYRLKPHAIDVRLQVDPVDWFLKGKEDVRSSFYLEDAATEYRVQGLELDWTCVTWDADFRFSGDDWEHWKFVGERWNRVRKNERKKYLKNAYRVLLTRARQGMVIFVPHGDSSDPTRKNQYYEKTYDYLNSIGFDTL